MNRQSLDAKNINGTISSSKTMRTNVGVEYRPKTTSDKSQEKFIPNSTVRKSVKTITTTVKKRKRPIQKRIVMWILKTIRPADYVPSKNSIRVESVSTMVATNPIVRSAKKSIKFKETTANKTLSFFAKVFIVTLFCWIVSSTFLRSIEIDYAMKLQETQKLTEDAKMDINNLNTTLARLTSTSRLLEYAKEFGMDISYDRIKIVDDEKVQSNQ